MIWVTVIMQTNLYRLNWDIKLWRTHMCTGGKGSSTIIAWDIRLLALLRVKEIWVSGGVSVDQWKPCISSSEHAYIRWTPTSENILINAQMELISEKLIGNLNMVIALRCLPFPFQLFWLASLYKLRQFLIASLRNIALVLLGSIATVFYNWRSLFQVRIINCL